MSTGFGLWPSPLAAADLVADAAIPSALIEDGDSVWWSESRPSDGGRSTVLKFDGANVSEITPNTNVRTRVHEYGGGAWTVCDGVLYYVEFDDQRLWRLEPGAEAVCLSAEAAIPCGLRYADLSVSSGKDWVLCVRESHGEGEPANELVAVATDGSLAVRTLASGADFYSSPRLSPDGSTLAWIQWDHPNMPWDETELWQASFADGVLSDSHRLAGDAEALQQPRWSNDGRLHVVSDRSGSWQIHGVLDNGLEKEPQSDAPGEIGVPPWVFGTCSFVETDRGFRRVETVPGVGDLLVEDDGSTSAYTEVATLGARSEIAASWAEEHAVYVDGQRVSAAPTILLGTGFLTPPVHVDVPSDAGTVHAWFYAPANPNCEAPADELPPLLMTAHGGPTGAARTGLQLGVRYWTSRGFAVVDVNYRGSTGYGRSYRRSLEGLWGVADVEDCIAVARHLVALGMVDPDRLGIRGGSAGGLTVLGALVADDVFTAGVSRYGVSDLAALAEDTHKFEARYLDRLVGPYPAEMQRYRDRSPLFHVEQISAPMLVLQGLDDVIVPPSQSEAIVKALERNGVAVEYLAFEGEAHGFRRADTIVSALEAELAFFQRTWGL